MMYYKNDHIYTAVKGIGDIVPRQYVRRANQYTWLTIMSIALAILFSQKTLRHTFYKTTSATILKHSLKTE